MKKTIHKVDFLDILQLVEYIVSTSSNVSESYLRTEELKYNLFNTIEYLIEHVFYSNILLVIVRSFVKISSMAITITLQLLLAESFSLLVQLSHWLLI